MILLRNFDINFSENDLNYIFEQYDKDNSLTFDFDEFKNMLTDKNDDQSSCIDSENSQNDSPLNKMND